MTAMKHAVLPMMPEQQTMNNLQRLVDVYGSMTLLEQISAHEPLFRYFREEGVFPSGKMLEFLVTGPSTSSCILQADANRAEMAVVRQVSASVALGIDVQYSKLGGDASPAQKHAALSEYARRMTTVRNLLRVLGLVRSVTDTLENVIIDFIPKMIPSPDVPAGQRKKDSIPLTLVRYLPLGT